VIAGTGNVVGTPPTLEQMAPHDVAARATAHAEFLDTACGLALYTRVVETPCLSYEHSSPRAPRSSTTTIVCSSSRSLRGAVRREVEIGGSGSFPFRAALGARIHMCTIAAS
jgi:hypothetical protein